MPDGSGVWHNLRERLAGSNSVQNIVGLFAKAGFERRHQRIDCDLPTEITIVERNISYKGQLKNISGGGALFRPRSLYILERSNSAVLLSLGGVRLYGIVASTLPVGYGIRFDKVMDEKDLLALIEVERKIAQRGQPKSAREEASVS